MIRPFSTTSAAIALAALLLTGCDRFTSVETRLTQATANLDAGEYQNALIDVRKALAKEPQNIDAQLLLVDVLAGSGEAQSAKVQLDRAIAAGAPPSKTEVRQLDLLLSTGDLDSLRKVLAASTTLQPGQRENFEGRIALLENHPAAALALFEKSLSSNPELTDAALGRTEALFSLGRSGDAVTAIDELVTREPAAGRGWLLKGSLAMQAGNFPAAIEAFTTAIEKGRGLGRVNLVQAHALRIESYLAASQLASAQSSIAALEAAAGGSAIVSLMRGKVALASGDAPAAVSDLRKFTQAAPQHLGGRLLLTSALLEQGSTEQAFAEAVRNVAEFSGNDEPRLALADIQVRQARVADAEETLLPLTTRTPPNPLAIASLAELRIRRGEAIAGVSMLEQSLAERPDNPRLRLQLAAAYLSTGEAKRALNALERVDGGEFAAARDRLRVIATAALEGNAAAEKEIEAAVARHPEDVDLLLMAAAFQSNADHPDEARDFLQKARGLHPNDSTLSLTLGRLELSVGRPNEAEALAKAVLDKTPDDAGAMALMAGIAAQRGQDAEVDAWLNRARIAKPGALDVRIALARRAMARGNSGEARSVLEEAVRNAPADPTAQIALAELNAGIGRLAEAMAGLREAARGQPNSPAILLAMARVQLTGKDTTAARATLKRALEITPGWIPAATTLAGIEIAAGNSSAALEVVRSVRRADPDGAASYTLEGDVYMATSQPAEAATSFMTAYHRAPGAILATRSAQAKMAAKIPDPEAELLDWLKRTPTDAVARRTLAEYHMSAGRNAEAISDLEKVVEARPKDIVALNNLAWLYEKDKDPKALSTAEKAYNAAPKVAAIADTYGWNLTQGGKLQDGLKILSEAAELAPDNAQIQFHFAYALSAANQPDRAKEVLRRALGSGKRFDSKSEAEQLLARLERG